MCLKSKLFVWILDTFVYCLKSEHFRISDVYQMGLKNEHTKVRISDKFGFHEFGFHEFGFQTLTVLQQSPLTDLSLIKRLLKKTNEFN